MEIVFTGLSDVIARTLFTLTEKMKLRDKEQKQAKFIRLQVNSETWFKLSWAWLTDGRETIFLGGQKWENQWECAEVSQIEQVTE